MGIKMPDRKDEFWDIERLVPKREKPRYVRPMHDTEAVEIELEAKKSESTVVSRVIPPREPEAPAPSLPELEYSPVSPLISLVKIYRLKSGYSYYEQFCDDAEQVAKLPPAPAECVPYFSYVPQFSQLSRSQLAFYVYFRDCAYRGERIKAEYSYILLLIYEIINRGECTDVAEGQRVLTWIWQNYREEFPRIERSLCEWICDYSLIHRLPPPTAVIEGGVPEGCALKEFFIYYGKDSSLDYARALMKFCSAYDYKKSKFCLGDAAALFDRHILGALSYVLKSCSEPGKILSAAALEDNTITREAYAGALCASTTRRRIEVAYCSFSRSHELRFLIADIIKYSENKLRAMLGVKSRLSVYSVPDKIAAVINEYFAAFRAPKPKHAEHEIEAYERLYDAPHTELSVANAEKIESSSWRVTQLLVDAFDGEVQEPEPIPEKNEPPEGESDLRAALGEKYEFLKAALEENAKKQKEIAARLGELPDVLADEINEIAAELIGDIILEDVGGYYAVIEDYKELAWNFNIG